MPTILVAIDFSIGSDRALRRATILARESGASLHLLHVEEAATAEVRRESAAAAYGRLARIARAIAEFDGIVCDSEVVAGDAAEEIAVAAGKLGASLIVTGPHEPRFFLDLISRPTAEALAKRSGVPVLMANTLPALGYNRILVPTGLDRASVQIVESIAASPLRRAPDVFMLYLREPVSALRLNSSEDRDDYLRQELTAARNELRAFIEEHRLTGRVRWEARLNQSTTGREIEDAASEFGCDAVAISSSQKPFLEKLVVGSVAEAVVREVDSDIVIFP